ncbi:hypothetical protein BLA28_32165 [Eisenbergiella tayi]|nr:hypothetical protein BLA28_32165 [Eisenbergiella tayi]
MARAAKNIAGKDEEKEEYALTLGREGGPKAERTPGERDAEGSFGIGGLNRRLAGNAVGRASRFIPVKG